jgi:hypothetical protein
MDTDAWHVSFCVLFAVAEVFDVPGAASATDLAAQALSFWSYLAKMKSRESYRWLRGLSEQPVYKFNALRNVTKLTSTTGTSTQ